MRRSAFLVLALAVPVALLCACSGSSTEASNGGASGSLSSGGASGSLSSGGASGTGLGGVGNAGGGQGGVVGGNPFPCGTSVPSPPDSGYEQCSAGYVHRPQKLDCPDAAADTAKRYHACVRDEDCGASQVCQCSIYAGQTESACVSSSCTTDADCAAGFLCALDTSNTCVLGGGGFACQLPTDTCISGASCGSCNACFVQPTGRACGDSSVRSKCCPPP